MGKNIGKQSYVMVGNQIVIDKDMMIQQQQQQPRRKLKKNSEFLEKLKAKNKKGYINSSGKETEPMSYRG